MPSKSKGARQERALARWFDDAGYMVIRSPSSGSATARDQPDVLAGNREETLAFEVKYHGESDGIIYLDSEEIDALKRFGEVFDAFVFVVARWAGEATFYLFDPFALPQTDGGKYKVDRFAGAEAYLRLADSEASDGLDPGALSSREKGVVK